MLCLPLCNQLPVSSEDKQVSVVCSQTPRGTGTDHGLRERRPERVEELKFF